MQKVMEVAVPPLAVLHPDHRLFRAELGSNPRGRSAGRPIPHLGLFHHCHAEAVLRQEFDPVDIVTEVINRAERALEKSVAAGAGMSVALPPSLAAAAVA